jgi:hypothetical protein
MIVSDSFTKRKVRPVMKLPTIEDFTSDPENDLDGEFAWRQFGGLTVDEAYDKFCERPDLRPEDFMAMGDAAFVFYFPVIDRYMRQKEPQEEFDLAAHFLASAISEHVSQRRALVRRVYGQIIDLCNFVLDALKSANDEMSRDRSLKEIEQVWLELLNKTSGLVNSSDSE